MAIPGDEEVQVIEELTKAPKLLEVISRSEAVGKASTEVARALKELEEEDRALLEVFADLVERAR